MASKNGILQRRIFDNVTARGYGPREQGLTDEQFVARQLAMLIQEAAEALQLFYLPGGYRIAHQMVDHETHQRLKWWFQDTKYWQGVELIGDPTDLLSEIADCGVPFFCAAEVLGVSGVSLAADKSEQDIERGTK